MPAGEGAAPTVIAELERLTEGGDGAAACSLGDHYKTGDVLLQDYPMAIRCYRRGAELGDPEAQNNLGTMLLNALGCERVAEQAVYWYRKGAEQGLATAQYNLAKRYLHGDGVDRDYGEALKWFEKAAVQGESWASCELGTMYGLGQGVDRNLLAAADFHLIAAAAGDQVACSNLADDRAELEEMAVSGSQMASLFLCRIYNRGFGVEKNQSMTWVWILWAKKHCNSDTDAEIVQEVNEAYDFYRKCISSENRKLGARTLADIRAARRKLMGLSAKAKPGRKHYPDPKKTR
jgi:TPR repeat protein